MAVEALEDHGGEARPAGALVDQQAVRAQVVAVAGVGEGQLHRGVVHQGVELIDHALGEIVCAHAGDDQLGDPVLVQILQAVAHVLAVGDDLGEIVLPGVFLVVAAGGVGLPIVLDDGAVKVNIISDIQIGRIGLGIAAGAGETGEEAPAVGGLGHVGDGQRVLWQLLQLQAGVALHGLLQTVDHALRVHHHPEEAVGVVRVGDEPGLAADGDGLAAGVLGDDHRRAGALHGGGDRGPLQGQQNFFAAGKGPVAGAFIVRRGDGIARRVGIALGGIFVLGVGVESLVAGQDALGQHAVGEADVHHRFQIVGRAVPGQVGEEIVAAPGGVPIAKGAVHDQLGPESAVMLVVRGGAAGEAVEALIDFPALRRGEDARPLGGDDQHLQPPVAVQVGKGIGPGLVQPVAHAPFVVVGHQKLLLFLRRGQRLLRRGGGGQGKAAADQQQHRDHKKEKRQTFHNLILRAGFLVTIL